jgi:hypothetical protein
MRLPHARNCAAIEIPPKIVHFPEPAVRCLDGTIDALSSGNVQRERKENVVTGALDQMETLGLILVGAAVVLFGSIFNPRQSDPMGMFGLPSVCAIACRPVSVKDRAANPIKMVSRHANREAA